MGEGRPVTVVEVRARSMQYGARDGRSNIFFGGSGKHDFPRRYFHLLFSPFFQMVAFFAHS